MLPTRLGACLRAVNRHRLPSLYLLVAVLLFTILCTDNAVIKSVQRPLQHTASFFDDNAETGARRRAQADCRVPTLLGTRDAHTPIEAAFADAWKRRCQLDQEKFTIMMTGSTPRLDVVKRNMEKFTSGKIPSLAAVHLRWIGTMPAIPLYDPQTSVIPVRVVQQANDSLNARWQPIPDLTTAWIFSHDDDLEIDPEDFEWAWQTAKEFRPAVTSFVGRRFKTDPHTNEPIYDIGVKGDAIAMGTSASWIHSAFVDVYDHDSIKPVRDMVEETRNCEDIAMAFIVSYLVHVPPVLVNGLHNILHWQFRANMVSGDEHHWVKRDLCTRTFYKHFGEMPSERGYTVLRGMSPGDRKIQLIDARR